MIFISGTLSLFAPINCTIYIATPVKVYDLSAVNFTISLQSICLGRCFVVKIPFLRSNPFTSALRRSEVFSEWFVYTVVELYVRVLQAAARPAHFACRSPSYQQIRSSSTQSSDDNPLACHISSICDGRQIRFRRGDRSNAECPSRSACASSWFGSVRLRELEWTLNSVDRK